MLIAKSTLAGLIREAMLFEAGHGQNTVKTRKGKDVPWGSAKHVADLQASLDELIRIRDAQPRTSRSRYIYARAVEETRKQYKAAYRFGIRKGWLEDAA